MLEFKTYMANIWIFCIVVYKFCHIQESTQLFYCLAKAQILTFTIMFCFFIGLFVYK